MPFYLVYTPTRKKTLQSKRQDVRGKLGGFWEAGGIRKYVVDESGRHVRSYLKYSFKIGTLDNRESEKQNTTWNMVEYQDDTKLENNVFCFFLSFVNISYYLCS